MLSSLAVAINIPAEWLAILAVAVPVAIYLSRRRDAQSSTVTRSEILTEKSVKNIEEQWTKLDDIKSRLAYLEGAHAAKGCFPSRPPEK